MAMACSSAESDAPRTESPQSSLVDTAIHRLNIAIEVIPRSLTIKVEVRTLQLVQTKINILAIQS